MNVTRIFDLLDQYNELYLLKEDALVHKVNDQWVNVSTSEYIDRAYSVSFALRSLGIKKGDKVATVMKNSPEWNYMDMGLMMIGAIHVPAYSTISETTFRYIFNEAEIKIVIISTHEMVKQIMPVIKEIPSIEEVYCVEDVEGVKTFNELLDLGKNGNRNEIDKIKSTIKEDDVATIIYTSGTTGAPKGVMLSHKNIISNLKKISDVLKENMVETALSFLPVCHVYERILNYTYQAFGMTIFYAESIEKVGDNMQEVHPGMFCAVPRVIEKSFDKIMAKGRDLKGIKKMMFFWALNIGYRYVPNKNMGWWYRLKHKIVDKLVFSKWRDAMGGRLQVIVSGGATLQPRLSHVFWAAGIKVMEGYGLTETSPVIAVATFKPDGVKIGTVGPVMMGQVKFAPDGEILFKGPNVMLGYFKKPEETKKVIDSDGWFHTGDIGVLEDEKYLRITDRKKEIFKTSGGKYIAPQVLESKFKESSFIENIMVVGENKNFPAAIIIPNFDHLKSWCRVKGLTYMGNQEAIKIERIVNRIQREVDEMNAGLDRTEQIKKIVLLDKPWSVEDGDLSQTLKLKRKYLLVKLEDIIEGIYT